MADFVAVLKKTIEGLKDNSPQMREKVYEKARATIEAKLAALSPAPPAAIADRQRQSLESAIAEVRAHYDMPTPLADPGFEEDFSGFFGDEPEPPQRDSLSQQGGDAFADDPYQPTPARRAEEFGGTPLADQGAQPSYADPADTSSDAYDDEGDWRQDPDDADAESAFSDAEDDDDGVAVAPPIYAPRMPLRKKRRIGMGLIVALLALVIIAGAGYGIWLNRDDFTSMLGLAPETAETQPAPPEEAEEVAVAPDGESEPEETPAAPEPEVVPAEEEPGTEKFTQRLLPDGTEVDEGAADEEPSIGEGTSVAAVTPADEAQGATSAPASQDAQADDQPQLAVGQRAIFYEERTASAEGSAETGTILWSIVQESPGGDLPPEPAIRAEVTVPSRDLQLRMTIRRNGDQSLPASHIIEMIFLTPDNFAGGTIDNVLRVAMKDTEQAPGSPLIGIPAKIADGFFLFALSDSASEIASNTTLMRRQNWIDIPITYGSGRRALMTMEKGIPGDRVFQQALRVWGEAMPIAEDGDGQ